MQNNFFQMYLDYRKEWIKIAGIAVWVIFPSVMAWTSKALAVHGYMVNMAVSDPRLNQTKSIADDLWQYDRSSIKNVRRIEIDRIEDLIVVQSVIIST